MESTTSNEHLLKPGIFAKPDALVNRDPFPFTVVKGSLADSLRPTVAADFPKYDRSGFFPYVPAECGPSVQRLVDDMRSPEFADALGSALGVPVGAYALSRLPSDTLRTGLGALLLSYGIFMLARRPAGALRG